MASFSYLAEECSCTPGFPIASVAPSNSIIISSTLRYSTESPGHSRILSNMASGSPHCPPVTVGEFEKLFHRLRVGKYSRECLMAAEEVGTLDRNKITKVLRVAYSASKGALHCRFDVKLLLRKLSYCLFKQ